jgi:hypothetical protein
MQLTAPYRRFLVRGASERHHVRAGQAAGG